ncbi:MAG: DUF116 domain-containing protein [Methanosarcinaceae archaeon]|nr:DUF116 domain-containing protein [Methanosarcinaceae archaeon]
MYDFLGKLIIIFIIISIILVFLSIYIGRKEYAVTSVFIYKRAENILDFFLMPLLMVYRFFRNDTEKLYKKIVNVKNNAHRADFKKTKNRIIIAPHCMRHINCPAFSTTEGIICKKCNLCVFTEMSDLAEEYGYKLFIITGSSFVKRILTSENCKDVDGVLAIGCDYEINKGMRELKPYKKIVTYGIPLINSGCYNTYIDFEKFKKVLKELEPEQKKQTTEH